MTRRGAFLRRLALLLLAGAGGLLPARAQDAPAPAVAAARPLLWALADADSRVYLLGSIHLLPAGTDPLPGAAAAAYADAEVLAFELDLDSAAAQAPRLLAAGFDAGGPALAERLGARTYARLDSALQAAGLAAAAFERAQPWLVAIVLTQVASQRAGLAAEGGVDAQLFARARADGRPRVALETLDQQLAVFETLGEDAQLAMLAQALDELDAHDPTLDRMLAAWRAGDADGLAALSAEMVAANPELGERMLGARNRAWVPQLEALLARTGEDVLVVVGAGHLAGPGNVVELLRARGHAVERL